MPQAIWSPEEILNLTSLALVRNDHEQSQHLIPGWFLESQMPRKKKIKKVQQIQKSLVQAKSLKPIFTLVGSVIDPPLAQQAWRSWLQNQRQNLSQNQNLDQQLQRNHVPARPMF